MTTKTPNTYRPCPVCGVEKNIRGICKSEACFAARTCVDCKIHLRLGPSVGPRCYTCHLAHKRVYDAKYHGRGEFPCRKNKKHGQIQLPDGRCKTCPSLSQFGRCGGVTSGDKQLLPAVAVRLLGDCPRRHGVRKDLDQWIARRKNLDLPPLDSHRRVVGKPGPYIDEVKCYE